MRADLRAGGGLGVRQHPGSGRGGGARGRALTAGRARPAPAARPAPIGLAPRPERRQGRRRRPGGRNRTQAAHHLGKEDAFPVGRTVDTGGARVDEQAEVCSDSPDALVTGRDRGDLKAFCGAAAPVSAPQ
ncbi:hypothetical protein GCM10018987_06950 [Streptomyces cremeus]